MGLKARVKATGEIVEVTRIVDRYVMTHHPYAITFAKDELDFNIEIAYDPDYWTRLEHQAAIAAMQGLMSCVGQITPKKGRSFCDEIVDISLKVAHALVEKMKEVNNG